MIHQQMTNRYLKMVKDKSESSDQVKLTNDKPPVGGFDQQIGNTEQTDNNEFVDPDTDTDTDTERTLIPMRRIRSLP